MGPGCVLPACGALGVTAFCCAVRPGERLSGGWLRPLSLNWMRVHREGRAAGGSVHGKVGAEGGGALGPCGRVQPWEAVATVGIRDLPAPAAAPPRPCPCVLPRWTRIVSTRDPGLCFPFLECLCLVCVSGRSGLTVSAARPAVVSRPVQGAGVRRGGCVDGGLLGHPAGVGSPHPAFFLDGLGLGLALWEGLKVDFRFFREQRAVQGCSSLGRGGWGPGGRIPGDPWGPCPGGRVRGCLESLPCHPRSS